MWISRLPKSSGARRSKNHIEIFGLLDAASSSNRKCRSIAFAPAQSTFWANEGSCWRQSQNVLKLSPLTAQAMLYGRPRAIAFKRRCTRSGVFLGGRPPLLLLRTAPVCQRGSGSGNTRNRCANCRNLLDPPVSLCSGQAMPLSCRPPSEPHVSTTLTRQTRQAYHLRTLIASSILLVQIQLEPDCCRLSKTRPRPWRCRF